MKDRARPVKQHASVRQWTLNLTRAQMLELEGIVLLVLANERFCTGKDMSGGPIAAELKRVLAGR